MYLDDGSEVITMNYMDTVCNGGGGGSGNQSHPAVMATTVAAAAGPTTTTTATGTNLNWLIHAFYARHDFAQCRSIIEKQLRQHVDKEYGWLVKGLIARSEGDPLESLVCLQQAINANPTQATSYKEMGRTL